MQVKMLGENEWADISSAEMCRRAGTSHRCLNHWINAGIIDLPHLSGLGSGTFRMFTESEARAIEAVAAERRRLNAEFKTWSTGAYWADVVHTMVSS